MKKWKIFSEGWRATGERGDALFHGEVEAETFKEACDKLFKGDSDYNSERLCHWGCRLFPTWEEANRLFPAGQGG